MSLFSWGRQKEGQCGREEKEDMSYPLKIDIPVTFRQVEAAGTRSLAISSDGVLYSWGTGYLGELGLSYQEYCSCPTPIEKLLTTAPPAAAPAVPGGPGEEPTFIWKQIACGFQYTLALTEDGEVYSWGANYTGQLGLGHTKMTDRPTKIPTLQKITKIKAAHTHAMALNAFGEIFSWGSNHCAQLGRKAVENFAIPAKITFPADVTTSFRYIDCNDTASAAISTKGELYTWGSGGNGILGHGNTRLYDEPELVKEVKDVPFLQVSLGTHHALALTETKQIYAWGAGHHGELGTGTRRRQLKPVLLNSREMFSHIFAADESSFAITVSGALLSWGNCNGGLLGNGRKVGNVLVPTRVAPSIEFKSINVSKKHVIAIGTGNSAVPYENWIPDDENVDPDAKKKYEDPETEDRDPEAYLYNLYFPKDVEKRIPKSSTGAGEGGGEGGTVEGQQSEETEEGEGRGGGRGGNASKQ